MSELILVANAADGTISTLRLHRDPAPRLEVLDTSGDVDGCGTFAVDADRDLVFAAYKGEPAGIATLRLDRTTGELTELSRRATGDAMTYLSLASGGAALLGVSYSGGLGAVWPVVGTELAEPHSRFAYDNLHCVVTVPTESGERVYAVSLGEDLVAQFTLGDGDRLTPLEPATVPVTPGAGARHLVVDGSSAYLVTEFSGELIRFTVHPDGTLERAEATSVVDPGAGLQHSRFGADPKAARLIWGADVHVARGWVITSERSSSQLTLVRRGADGRLGEVVGYIGTEQTPRGFAVSDDGRFVVAVGEDSTHAQLLELLPDGALEQRDRVTIGRGANWVRWV